MGGDAVYPLDPKFKLHLMPFPSCCKLGAPVEGLNSSQQTLIEEQILNIRDKARVVMT